MIRYPYAFPAESLVKPILDSRRSVSIEERTGLVGRAWHSGPVRELGVQQLVTSVATPEGRNARVREQSGRVHPMQRQQVALLRVGRPPSVPARCPPTRTMHRRRVLFSFVLTRRRDGCRAWCLIGVPTYYFSIELYRCLPRLLRAIRGP